MQRENKKSINELKDIDTESLINVSKQHLQIENKWQDRLQDLVREELTYRGYGNNLDDTMPLDFAEKILTQFIQSKIDTARAEEREKLWNDANGIVALFGAILMSKGIVGEEKETIKECLASVIKNVLNK